MPLKSARNIILQISIIKLTPTYNICTKVVAMAKNFPFEIRVAENDNKELSEYFTDFYHPRIQIGPKNYSLLEDYKYEAANIYNLPLKPGDVFVVSFPRSGTTWTQELVWLVANNLDYEKAAGMPLTTRYTFIEFSMFMSIEYRKKVQKQNPGREDIEKALNFFGTPGVELVAKTPSPRFVKTHLPLTLLPPNLLDIGKVVYVARDPRDVAVSFYHHKKLFQFAPPDADFKTFWKLFVRGMVLWGPFFDHLKEAWQMRNHPNMLFLFYEELSKDLSATVRRVVDFLGKQYTDKQIEDLCTHLTFENFKNNPSVNMDEVKEMGLLSQKESFIRKGKTGGWREYFDEEMTKEAERWISENLRDTGIRFQS